MSDPERMDAATLIARLRDALWTVHLGRFGATAEPDSCNECAAIIAADTYLATHRAQARTIATLRERLAAAEGALGGGIDILIDVTCPEAQEWVARATALLPPAAGEGR